jgi:hypothetical protein
MKATLLAKMNREQLRSIVSKIITIDAKKLEKMSSEKCLRQIYAHDLSYNQIKELSK